MPYTTEQLRTMLAGITPGPWTHKATAGDHDFLIYPESTGRDVALVRDFNEPNARAIAALPADRKRDQRYYRLLPRADVLSDDFRGAPHASMRAGFC